MSLSLSRPQLKTTWKRRLKCSAFLASLPNVLRGVIRDLKVAAWSSGRPFTIRRYLREHGVRKLHLGASGNLLPGWLNTDLCVDRNGLIYLDATRRFPLPDNSIDYIFSEHMIEHLEYKQGQFMLSECFRVLKPGGTIRTTTPNLAVSLKLYGEPTDPELREYQDWFARREFPHLLDDRNRGTFIINLGVRAWGHQFLYDKNTLSDALIQNGFVNLRFPAPLRSEDPELCGIEGHGNEIGTQRWNEIEAFVVEARKPVRIGVPQDIH